MSHPISTAACLIIGDEILNGKIHDTNSYYFAKYCFNLGIDVRHVAVVPDEEEDIKSKVSELASRYDFIVTSGGIGPTHDDITYEAIANAFNLKLELHQGTVDRMKALSKFNIDPNDPHAEETMKAQLRMATLPVGPNVEYHYVQQDMWVPIVAIDGKVHILPGIPSIFQRLLEGLKPSITTRVAEENQLARYYVKTAMRESEIAPYLDKLQKTWQSKGIKIGSYPHMKLRSNTVSIIGPHSLDQNLKSIVKDVESNVNGQEINAEEEASRTGQE